LIGADGIKSNIRRQMLGPEKNVYTGNVAWRGIVPASKLPIDHIPPCANNWLGPKRHFVSYYIRGGDYINFVAIEERDEWTEENWSQRGDMNKLRAAFSGWDSRVTDLLNACEDCHLWGLFDHPPLAGWTEGRVALLGDAAHPMLPFLAQGASSGSLCPRHPHPGIIKRERETLSHEIARPNAFKKHEVQNRYPHPGRRAFKTRQSLWRKRCERISQKF